MGLVLFWTGLFTADFLLLQDFVREFECAIWRYSLVESLEV